MNRVAAFALRCTLVFLACASALARQHGVEALSAELKALSPRVRHEEAASIALCAYQSAVQLRREYQSVASPHLHNFLVNAGFRKRGLCHHWARDLGGRLAALKVRTLELRWAIARPGSLREHNAVVVTARGQAFERGIVLDAWRHSGRLFFAPVASDRYAWKEDRLESFTPARVGR